jgi:hypothetical protein
MLTKTNFKFNIEPIIAQLNTLPYFERSLKLNETDGNLLSGVYRIKPEFVNTPLGDVLDSLGNIGEARLLKLLSAQSYTAHCDPDDRYDLVITTNPNCYLINIEENSLHHLPVTGEIWKLDTSIKHTASNFGSRDRVYLNIRERLPEFISPGIHFYFTGGDFDWKQVLYEDIMGYINRKIKEKEITGIEKVNDRELRLNCTDEVRDYIYNNATSKGFTVILKYL